ncbi:MAG TPA: glycosyltransferase family 39 protein [Pelomicrobium sp.]|nr:glycosyltransferase family 39 protein [Pelomicrobium sp.]
MAISPFRPPASPYTRYQDPHHGPLMFALILAAWLVAGVVGHDPWKPDETEHFGIVYSIILTGDWVVPALAGIPELSRPPLYYAVAALFARVFDGVLPLHDGARLATAFFMGLTFLFAGLAARELYGKGYGRIGVLVLLGCLGLIIRGHQILPETALLAGAAMVVHGLALGLRLPGTGGLVLGTGIGVAFMAEGLLAPAVGAVVVAILPFVSRQWRTRKMAASVVIAVVVAAPWLVVWPYLLNARSPELFRLWLETDLGRFPGVAGVSLDSATFYLQALPWFAWPALPLALWTLWHEGRAGLAHPGIHLPLIAFFVALAGASLSPGARDVEGLPLLLPLALLGAGGLYTLRRGAANSMYWFSIMGFSALAAAAWFYWAPLALTVPDRLFQHLDRMRPGYNFGFRPLAFGFGLLLTIGWIVLIARLRRNAQRPIIAWAAGVTLVWGLLMSLLIGYIDHAKSYRTVVSSMRTAIPTKYDCMASLRAGPDQRAMVHYYAGIMTKPVNGFDVAGCELLLQVGHPDEWVDPEGGWERVWEGRRPRDKTELWALYVKKPDSPPPGPKRPARRR